MIPHYPPVLVADPIPVRAPVATAAAVGRIPPNPAQLVADVSSEHAFQQSAHISVNSLASHSVDMSVAFLFLVTVVAGLLLWWVRREALVLRQSR